MAIDELQQSTECTTCWTTAPRPIHSNTLVISHGKKPRLGHVLAVCSQVPLILATPPLLLKRLLVDRNEIKQWYAGFIKDCPSGQLGIEGFKRLYETEFPFGEGIVYANAVWA